MSIGGLPIHIADVAIVAFLIFAGLTGLATGAGRQAYLLARLAVATAVAVIGYRLAAPSVLDLLLDEGSAALGMGHSTFATIIAGATAAGLFLLGWVIVWGAAGLIHRPPPRGSVGSLSRSLGFVVGLVRGSLLLILAYIVISWMIPLADWSDRADGARGLALLDRASTLLRPAGEPGDRAAVADGDRLRELSVPVPTPNSGADRNQSGYNRGAREQLDRLIDGAQ